jgi:hypothetical protein
MQHSPGTATTATDLYAAAVTMVEMVTGEDLFEDWTQKKLINEPEVCDIFHVREDREREREREGGVGEYLVPRIMYLIIE